MQISEPSTLPARPTMSHDNHGLATAPSAGRPLRVLHILNRLDRGGTELIVLKVMEGLSKVVFEHRLASLRGSDPEFQAVALPDGKLLSAGPVGGGFQFPLFRLARMMRAYRPHIVHSRNWGAIEAIPAARLAGVPVAIHSEHGYELDMLAGLPNRRRVFRRAVYAMADAVFAVTRELRDYHAKQAWISSQRIRVVYNGVDTQKFCPRPDLRAAARKRFGLSPNRFIVGAVGRMVPIKDHATLLRAVDLMTQRNVNAHVLFVGSGPELERTQELAAGFAALAGRVTFIGASDEVPEMLNAMDAFAQPSISEGMSNTLLEAMATALPVIATAVGGNNEVIDNDQSGWLIRTRDHEALASILTRLASQADLRGAFGSAARQRIIERFGLDRMLTDYTQLYLELASRRGIKVSGN